MKGPFQISRVLNSKLQNRLTNHVGLCATMFAHTHFILNSMPHKEAIVDWQASKTKCRQYMLNSYM
jgi:hypothetical protein